MSGPNKPGFVLPPEQPTYPPQQGAYPIHFQPAPPGYPSQQPASYPPQAGYPPAYNHQPFPGPIQQAANMSANNGSVWMQNTSFQEYLRNATSFHVKQKVELLEAIVGWETPNKYTVKDQAGNHVFLVGEDTGCCNRQLLGKHRPFTLYVKDRHGMDALMIDRPIDCTCCFGGCMPDSLTVSTASGQKLGSVKEEFSLLYPKFKIKDAAGNTVLKIEGPICPMSFGCVNPIVFRVMNLGGVSVGTISKEWSGWMRELFTDADYFSMSFPIDLDPAIKAVCLGALFLIDFQYFESGGGSSQGGRRLFG